MSFLEEALAFFILIPRFFGIAEIVLLFYLNTKESRALQDPFLQQRFAFLRKRLQYRWCYSEEWSAANADSSDACEVLERSKPPRRSLPCLCQLHIENSRSEKDDMKPEIDPVRSSEA